MAENEREIGFKKGIFSVKCLFWGGKIEKKS